MLASPRRVIMPPRGVSHSLRNAALKPKNKARDIAESYPSSKGNYFKAIDHLKSRFGRNDLLIEVYFRDLFASVNNKSAVKLTDLYHKLGSYLRALETLNMTTSNYAAMLYPAVESCLPAKVLKAWNRHRLNREVPEDLTLEKEKVLENFITFLCHEVEGEHRFLAENGDFVQMYAKENPTSPKDKVNNAKKKTSWITSELTSEEIQKARLAVIGIVRIEKLSELKEKIQWHFSSPSAPWYDGWWEKMEEYLGELVRNPKSTPKRKEITVGEIVFIESDNSKRLNWSLGRVIELYPGKDSTERAAKLQVANGFVIRPLQRLYPL
ncbi:transposable element Tc1 transposase [Trichonephila clavipes]|nr:transposable element Tc1 transposase [Trichonephila clavipes]